MKVMLVCTAGMSTSLVMKKIESYAKANQKEISLIAYPLQEYQEHVGEYDLMLLGPQISYRLSEIQKQVSIPVMVIDGLDYALGNAANIMKMIESIH